MSQSTEARVRTVLKEEMGLATDVDEIKLGNELAQYGVNSISFIRAVVVFEKKFNIEFDDENLDFNKFSTFGDLISYIDSLIVFDKE